MCRAVCLRNRMFAFTLVELLVVIAIVTLLIALLAPSYEKAREVTRATICAGNLHAIGIATAAYAASNNNFTVHGIDMHYAASGSGWGATGYGHQFWFTTIYDDDWGNAKAGTFPGNFNYETQGAQNLAGVGQLMWDDYLAEKAEAIACPQSDYREPFNATGGVNNFNLKSVRAQLVMNGNYWRYEYYTGTNSYQYHGASYTVRGPLMKYDAMQGRLALFTDQEQASGSIGVPLNASPLGYGWGRTHKEGYYVSYSDGSAALFHDADRTKTYWYPGGQCQWYGNGSVMQAGGYDIK